jgi:hypothetical protein
VSDAYAHTYSIRQRADGKFVVCHSFKTDRVNGWLHSYKTFSRREKAEAWVKSAKEVHAC